MLMKVSRDGRLTEKIAESNGEPSLFLLPIFFLHKI